MLMRKKKWRIVNNDLNDPLALNFMIYTYTFVLSILSAVISYIDAHGIEMFNVNGFVLALTDCIVPTTATLALGNLVQNFVNANKAGVTTFSLSLWTLLIVFVYVILYSAFGSHLSLCLRFVFLFISLCIIVLGMIAIEQVDRECHNNSKSISG